MEKTKDTMKKGFEKVTRMDENPRQEDRKATLNTAWSNREQHDSMTGGLDRNLAGAAHSGDPTGLTGEQSMGQPTNKPRP